jgi:hypothetical protein
MRNIAATSLVATGGMTLFSFLLSKLVKKNFLEPTLLNQLVFYREKAKKQHHPAGYVLHYLAGIFFTSVYSRIWKGTRLSPRSSDSLIMGFINGIIGASGWHLTFLAHPSPPQVNRRKYYLQLVAAHILFGLLNGIGYRKLKSGSVNETGI